MSTPFGRDENDLPLDAIMRTIEREILTAMGETQRPQALAPVDCV